MKRIVLHGRLKELHPAEILLDVKSAAEAIRALGTVAPELRPAPNRPRLCLRAVGFASDIELHAPTDKDEIHLVLDMSGGGGKGGGIIKIVIGVVLIALAFFTGGISLGGLGAISAGSLYLAGATFILGGILELVSSSPKLTGDPGTTSKYFGSPANTVKIGTPIPILYGTGQIYGQYVSMDIVTDQLVMVDPNGPPPPDFGPPTAVAATGYQSGVTVNWTPNASPHRTGTQLWRSFTSDFASAELVFDSTTGGANPAETHFNDDLQFQIDSGGNPHVPAWYWLRSVSDSPGFSVYTPDSTTAGITATTGAPATTGDGGGDSADGPGDSGDDSGDGSSSDGGGDGGGGDGG